MLARTRRAAIAEQNARAAEWMGQLMQQASAIALAQDRLSVMEGGGQDGTDIELSGYLRALLGSLDLSLAGGLVFETELERCTMPIDKAVAVGLVVNELVTNAAKYAYPGQEEGGAVRVTLRCDTTRAEAALTVSDEGQGMNASGTETRRAGGGQGTDLLRHLARQLGGDVEHGAPERGTSVTLRFPLVV
jgi:two-component sensor histidine kinase